MGDRPQTWHYGLVARWWAEVTQVDPGELAFYQGVIARDGQPALDLGCGTGRLLVPLVKAGLDVDGCDLIAGRVRMLRRVTLNSNCDPTRQIDRSGWHTLVQTTPLRQ